MRTGFTWRIHKNRYRWLSVSRSDDAEQWGPYVLSSGVDAETESLDANIYEPSTAEPGLFKIFASLNPTRKSILDFANRYGRLGGIIECPQDWQINTEGQATVLVRVEPWWWWTYEILFIKTMVDLWENVQSRNESAISRHIKWDSNTAIYQSGRAAGSLRLPAARALNSDWDPSSPEPWVIDIDDECRSAKIRGWVVHPKRDEPSLIESLRASPIDTGLYFLQVVLNRQLTRHGVASAQLMVMHGQLTWEHTVPSLIGLLWWQFAEAVVSNRSFKQCQGCRKWFESTSASVRSDKSYCSQTCRIRIYRARQAQVRELFHLGSTIQELADRFDSDVDTIRAWLKQG